MPISCSVVQQSYALGQIAFANSVAVFSIGMPLTPPQPNSVAVSPRPVKNPLVPHDGR